MLAQLLHVLVVWAATAPPVQGGRPQDVVALQAVAPTIEQDIRYAKSHNFTGTKVPGYDTAECLLTAVTAQALKEAQKELNVFGLGLKVYDCYRPARAVRFFAEWAKTPQQSTMAAEFFPRTPKEQLHAMGYIAHRSGHSRGSTVDITLVPYPAVAQVPFVTGQELQACILPRGRRFGDNSLDMGTGFDCLDVLAHTECPSVGQDARRNRLLLRQVMRRYGLINYPKEWWHFTYYNEPHKGQAFDFVIGAQPTQNAAPPL